MPDNHQKKRCIICGLPSETVVCVHCFFNYDYRTYNSRALEKKRMQKEPEIDFSDHGSETGNESLMPTRNELSERMPRIVRDEKITGNECEKSMDRNSPANWFSRLPRY